MLSPFHPCLSAHWHYAFVSFLVNSSESYHCLLQNFLDSFFVAVNPIALRKTKIAYNFSLFECSGVKVPKMKIVE